MMSEVIFEAFDVLNEVSETCTAMEIDKGDVG